MNNQGLSTVLGLATEPKTILHAPEVVTQKGVKKAVYFQNPIKLLPGHRVLCAPSSILDASRVHHAKAFAIPADPLTLEINKLKIEKVRALAVLVAPYNRLVDYFLKTGQYLEHHEVAQHIKNIEQTTQENPKHCYDFRAAALLRLLIVSPKACRGNVYQALCDSPYSKFSIKQVENRRQKLLQVFKLRAKVGYIAKETTPWVLQNQQPTESFYVWQHPAGDIENLKETIQAKLLNKSITCSKLALQQEDASLGEYAHEFASMAIDAGGVNNKTLVAKGIGVLLGGIPEYLISLEQIASHQDHFTSIERFERAIVSCGHGLKESPQARSLLGQGVRSKIELCALRQQSAMMALNT